MKILLYEHASGGGYAGQQVSPGILAEGFAMMRTLASDFSKAGHEVTVLIDARISKLNPPINADCTVPVFNSEEPKRFLSSLASINEASYIIAPETGQTLQNYVELMEQNIKFSLNCKSSAIQRVANKASLHETLEKNGINTARTAIISVNSDLSVTKKLIKEKLSYPVVFKPIDGVSCTGLSIVNNESQIELAEKKIKTESLANQFIVQEFIAGESASVSLLVLEENALAISLNKQNIEIATPDQASTYTGGCVPFDHPLKQEALQLAQKAVACFPGLRGYVGVDLVLAGKAFVVDINPRLTTSYVGLSQIATSNIGQALIDAASNSELPTQLPVDGYACFSKVTSTKPTATTFHKLSKLPAVVSPPFPLTHADQAISIVAGQDASVAQANMQLQEAKKQLLHITK